MIFYRMLTVKNSHRTFRRIFDVTPSIAPYEKICIATVAFATMQPCLGELGYGTVFAFVTFKKKRSSEIEFCRKCRLFCAKMSAVACGMNIFLSENWAKLLIMRNLFKVYIQSAFSANVQWFRFVFLWLRLTKYTKWSRWIYSVAVVPQK